MRNWIKAAACAAVAVAGFDGAAAQTAPDLVKGKTLFARCAVCHDVKPGVNRLGPSLAGVAGRKAGAVPGFKYSPAMKGAKVVWNAKALDGYLAGPAKYIPGNRMAFAGLMNPVERANLIAYLQTLK